MWTAAVALALVLSALAGCRGASAGSDVPIEQAAWIAAGVDSPDFELATDDLLRAGIDTSLPIDDTDDRGAGFAERAARIVWRTYPGRFERLALTVGHDGVELVTDELTRAELEDRLGPRPAGLDDGVARSEVAPDADGAFGELSADATVSSVLSEIVEPVVRRTLDEFFDTGDADIEFGEPKECLGGLTGNEPTGEYRADAGSSVISVDGSALATLPALTDYWRSLGLDVNTSNLDTGLDTIQVNVDDRATIVAKATDAGVSLSGHTRCLDPD
jgi:hypothetical protein